MMQPNRFWSSVWGVAAMLFGVGLLQYIMARVATLFGLLPAFLSTTAVLLVAIVVPVVGTLTYLDWKWGWKPEHIGLARTPAAIGHVAGGLVMGAVVAFLAHIASALLAGQALTPPAFGVASGLNLLTFLLVLLISFPTELIFRGAVISRYQSDLTAREILVAATLTPFAWMVVQGLFRFTGPPLGITNAWEGAMSISLALLFLRTDSVWLSAGLRAGMVASLGLLGLTVTETGGLVVWGTAAAILLAMEWFRQEGMPRRVQPSSRGSQRTYRGGRTIRGPWGPH